MAGVLAAVPGLRGIVFDTERGVARAPEALGRERGPWLSIFLRQKDVRPRAAGSVCTTSTPTRALGESDGLTQYEVNTEGLPRCTRRHRR